MTKIWSYPFFDILGRIGRFFQRLQWKLTLAYALFTLVTTILIGAVAIVLLWYMTFRSNTYPAAIAAELQKAVSPLAAYLAQQPPDRAGVSQWLRRSSRDGYLILDVPTEEPDAEAESRPGFFGQLELAAVTDPQGRVVATLPEGQISAGTKLARTLNETAVAPLQTALAGGTNSSALGSRQDEEIVAASPIFDQTGQLVGALLIKVELPINQGEFLQNVLRGTILPSAGIVLAVGIGVGSLFGLLIGRNLTRRLKALGQAADAWSRGHFGVLALDPSQDELGQLARHLNHMAIQLQNLLQTRQELATLEERNRLARDLHDSVKQQIFATSMQVGAAKALFNRQPSAAWEHLLEAEQLVKDAQQELAALIKELRPAALEGKGLAHALRDYVADWSRQNDIRAEVRIRGERPLPLPVEQTLFRVAQEGLANIARHSQATEAELFVTWAQAQVTLTITDNGLGFEVTAGQGNGLGLESMRERMEAIGGSLTVSSQPERGTRLTARVETIKQS